jgi:hypothetical protein
MVFARLGDYIGWSFGRIDEARSLRLEFRFG